MTDQITDKEKLEKAIGQVARSLDAAIKIVEKSSQLSNHQVDVGFQHITQLVGVGHKKAMLSVAIATAANNGYSLDMPVENILPATVTIQPRDRIAGERKAQVVTDDDGIDFE